MSRYGYIRVSTKEQNPNRQFDAMHEAGLDNGKIYLDKESGKDFKRNNYQKLLEELKHGDIVVIKSIDRLGRNYSEILEQWRLLSVEKGVGIEVLDMPLVNTTNRKDLTGILIADIVLQLLSYVAQTERDMIRQRQAEGIEAAKKRGVRFGRKPKVRPDSYEIIKIAWTKGDLSARKAAELLCVSHSTFLRWVSGK